MEEWVLNAKREAYEHGYSDGVIYHTRNINAYSGLLDIIEAKELIRSFTSDKTDKAVNFPEKKLPEENQDLVYRQYCENVESLSEENTALLARNQQLEEQKAQFKQDIETLMGLVERYQKELSKS